MEDAKTIFHMFTDCDFFKMFLENYSFPYCFWFVLFFYSGLKTEKMVFKEPNEIYGHRITELEYIPGYLVGLFPPFIPPSHNFTFIKCLN